MEGGPLHLKRSQTTITALERPAASDAAERLGSVGASSAHGRLGLLPRHREPPTRVTRQPSALKTVSEQHRKSADIDEVNVPSKCEVDGNEDGSSVYFAIETRLELKERLIAVQKQLDGVLMRTKLAWMRCFSSPSSSEQQQQQVSPLHRVSDDDSSGHDATMWAAELVERVEALAADLAVAFDHATSADSNNSLDEYKTLVHRSEQQLASLLALADGIASATPACFRRPERSTTLNPEEECPAAAAKPVGSPARTAMEGVAYPTGPVAFDLPSMKKYVARVAPPYVAYLPSKHRGR